MKYLITGVSASGKTTVASLLRKHGYTVYDGDKVSGLGHWVDSAGKSVKVPPRLTSDWIRRHSWNWERKHIERMLETDKTVFLCGASSNSEEFYPLFDKVFLLSIDTDTMKKRLNSRASGFGKFKQEQALAVEWHSWFENHHKPMVTAVIDANRSKQAVLDQIIDHVS